MTNTEKKKVQKNLLSKVFPALALTLFLFFITFLIAALKINFGILFISLSIMSIVVGILIFIVISKKLRQDLKINKVKLITGHVKDKRNRIDYEAGSATVPVTIWTLLTPKVLFKEMKQVDIYTAWINDDVLDLEKEDYDKLEVGEEVLIRRAYFSDLYLGLEKINA